MILHDARHPATTRILQGGVDLSTIQSFTGHSDKSMVLYYSHATPQSRERAAAVLESYAGNNTAKEDEELTADVIAALSGLVAAGKLSPLRLASILRGEEKLSNELIEELMVEA